MASWENDVTVCKNLNFDPAAPKPHLGIINAAGKLPIGTGNSYPTPEILAGSLTSPDSSITFGYVSPNITAIVNVAGGILHTLTGNSGVAAASAGNINVVTANSTVKFTGSGSTITEDFGLSNLILGSSSSSISSAASNVGLGNSSLLSLTTGGRNVAIGTSSSSGITTATNNVAVGTGALISTAGSSNNVAIGDQTLQLLGSSTGSNVGLGASCLPSVVTGQFNIAIGAGAGNTYVGAESSNIAIGNIGVVGESNIIRIGTSGSSTGQQNKTFVAAITGVTVSGSAPVAVDTNGQLSSLGFGTATNVLTSNGAGVSPSWQAAGGGATSPIFQAYLSANQSNVTGDNTLYTIPFDTTTVNTGSAFNTGTGVFTAPATGTYLFTGTVYLVEAGSFAGKTQANIFILATSANFALYTVNPATTNGNATLVLPFSVIIQMTSGDTAHVSVQVGNTTKTVLVGGLQGLSAFAGYKIA